MNCELPKAELLKTANATDSGSVTNVNIGLVKNRLFFASNNILWFLRHQLYFLKVDLLQMFILLIVLLQIP
jgi:hypothetical protein